MFQLEAMLLMMIMEVFYTFKLFLSAQQSERPRSPTYTPYGVNIHHTSNANINESAYASAFQLLASQR